MYVIGTEILVVAANNKNGALKEPHVRLFAMNTAIDAVGCLQGKLISPVVSRWDLEDAAQYRLLRSIVAAKGAAAVIAFIAPGNHAREKVANSLGVSIVLCNDIDNECFLEILCQLLGVSAVVSIRAADGHIAGITDPRYEADRFFRCTIALSSFLLGLEDRTTSPARKQDRIELRI